MVMMMMIRRMVVVVVVVMLLTGLPAGKILSCAVEEHAAAFGNLAGH
jgi:hypothetical protein